MIDLAVVSHSARAAKGVAKVTAQMGDGNTRIVPAGGDEDGIGTSPDRIRESIEGADDGNGVIVLVDLGSAVMSAEPATEATIDSKAVIASAPVLEGVLNAAVETTSKRTTLDSAVKRAEDAHGYRRLD